MYSAAKATYGIDTTRNGKNERRQDESTCGNRPDVGHSTGGGFGGISAELLDGASHRNSDRRISCPWNHHGICGNGYGMDTEFWR